MGRGWMQEYWFCYFLTLDCDFLGASSGKWLVHFQIYISFLYYQKIHTTTQIYINHIDIHIHMYFSTCSYLYLHIYLYIYMQHTHIPHISFTTPTKKSINFLGELSLRLDRPRWWFQSSNWIFGVKITKDLCVATPHEFIKNRKKRPLWSFFGCFFVVNLDNVFFWNHHLVTHVF